MFLITVWLCVCNVASGSITGGTNATQLRGSMVHKGVRTLDRRDPRSLRPMTDADVSPVFRRWRNSNCSGAWTQNSFIPRLTTQIEFSSKRSISALAQYGETVDWHRKQWEYIFLMKVAEDSGLYRKPNPKALGFAVGEERTVPIFVKHGVRVVATDLPPSTGLTHAWASTGQHMSGEIEKMGHGIATAEEMKSHVKLEWLDMNVMQQSQVWKAELGTFDFVWSLCSVEHVGSIKKALKAMIHSLEFLKPGGTAVHTTEFNLRDIVRTIEGDGSPGTVLFRQADSEALRACALRKGYQMPEICYDPGSGDIDMSVDMPPYKHHGHEKLELMGFVATCIGWTFHKPTSWRDNGQTCDDIFSDTLAWAIDAGMLGKR